MKKILFIALFITCFSQLVKADTTSYWHVYYNKIKMAELGGYGNGHVIKLKTNSIKTGDSITVRYHQCSPCHDCPTNLTAENGKHRVIASGQGKGSFNPVSFSLEAIKNSGLEYIEVFYFEGGAYSGAGKVLLFNIKLE
ncbi:MAG: hypothetical protein HOP10_04925 [Chitinophagaceae bacterium]|nr:hypothetical protein [Chitinophagaceae bacterium]